MSIPARTIRRHFASDNNAGACPEVWSALHEAEHDHVPGYGDDHHTARATTLIRELFETDCAAFFVFNGTAANSLVVATLCESIHSVICHQYSHLETDECGAPGFFAHGVKLRAVSGASGKLAPEAVHEAVLERSDVHAPAPRLVSITQATELGTIYSIDQIAALSSVCKEFGLYLHVDGARFANAVASLGCSPADLSWRAGVDVLAFGGTKNGMIASEAVVFFDASKAALFRRRCKQSGQLASKMRFLSAQWVGLLEHGVWLRNARRANEIAAHLEAEISKLPPLRVLYPRQANAVFVDMPAGVAGAAHALGWRFYTDVGPGGARLMCSWNSTHEDVDDFIADLRNILNTHAHGAPAQGRARPV